MKIRNGERNIEEVKNEIEELLSRINESKLINNLPASIDIETLSQWYLPLKYQALLKSDIPPVSSIISNEGHGNLLLKQRAEDLLDSNSLSGKILFVTTGGAYAYGIDTDTVDYIGVFVLNTARAMNALYDPITLIAENDEDNSRYSKGIILYEVQHYVEQLMKGDHLVIESLARLSQSIHDAWESSTFAILRTDSSYTYFSKPLVFHYLGVTTGLLKSCQANNEAGNLSKASWCLYLALRLITQAERILRNEMPDTALEESVLDKLKSLKNGEIQSIEEEIRNIEERIGPLKQEVKSIKSNEETKISLNNWIIGLRKALIE